MASTSGLHKTGYLVKRSCSVACESCSGPLCVSSECGKLCVHMYECDDSCYDYNNGHICKHIHRVQSLVLAQSGNTAVESSDHQCGEETYEDIDSLEYAGSILAPKNGTSDPPNC